MHAVFGCRQTMSRKLKPSTGTVLQTVPDLASKKSEEMALKSSGEGEKVWQLCRLDDRRVMEVRQELERIEQMGKVSGFYFG